jgi:hypothetical protein
MKYIKIVGLALLASFAFSMIASATASAELGIFECEKGVGTSNLGSNCLAETGGTFTIKQIVGETFTSKAGKTVLAATGGLTVNCEKATNEGVVTSLTEDRATIKFSECTSATKKCHNTSAAEAEGILLIPVSSKIVSYFGSGGVLRAGLLLAPRNETGANETEFRCGNTSTGTTIKVRGSVVGAITPEDENSLSFTVKFALSGSKQEITEKENSLQAKEGNTAAYEPATEEGTTLLDFPLKVEIMG